MNINHNHILSLMQTGFTTIGVVYEVDSSTATAVERARNRSTREKEYTYKALESDNLQVGDLVLVDSPSSGMRVVQVVRVDPKPRIDLKASFPYKWIVQKVDMTRYNNILEQEEKFQDALLEVERVRQREEVLRSFEETLPKDSEAYKLFQTTMESAKAISAK